MNRASAASRRPVFVHGKKRMDRTGLVIALHRVFNERWTAAAAMAVWDALGRNELLLALDDYFQDKTGWHNGSGEPIRGVRLRCRPRL
jgi:hypothetical protein